jgi:hypothetical protein
MALNINELIFTRSPAPTITDPPKCKTETLWKFLDNPTPTGSFRYAVESYSDSIVRLCTPTEQGSCRYPSKDRWCSMGTALPQELKNEAFFYGNSAYEWWSTHSAIAVSLVHECPQRWYHINGIKPQAQDMLDLTIKFAECIGEGYARGRSMDTTASVSTSSNGPIPTDTAGSTPMSGSIAAGNVPQPTKTSNANGRVDIGYVTKFKEIGAWITLGASMVFVAITLW